MKRLSLAVVCAFGAAAAPACRRVDFEVDAPARGEVVVTDSPGVTFVEEPAPVVFEQGPDFVVVVEGERHVRYSRVEFERRERERVGRNQRARAAHERR